MKLNSYPETKPTDDLWLPKLPSHWERKDLKYLARFVNGAPFKPADWGDIGTPIIRIENLNGSPQFNHVDFKADAKYEVRQGDLLFGWSGNRGTSFGPYIWREPGLFYLNQHIFRVTDIKLERQFFYWALKAVTTKVESQVSGIIGLVHITKPELGNIQVPVPPPYEQRAIANFLDSETTRLDNLQSDQERMVNLLLEQRRCLVAQLVSQGVNRSCVLRNSGLGWLGRLPAHWKLLPMKRLFRLIVDPVHEGHESYELLSLYTGLGVRPRKDLEQRGNRASSTEGYFRVQKGDFIVNKLLAWMGAIGLSEYDGVTSPAYDILRPIREMNARYYDYLFGCGICLPELKRYSRGIMNMRLRLYFDDFGPLRMPYPAPAEQDLIVQELDSRTKKIDTLIDKYRLSIHLLSELRKSLITAAVIGQIDVRNYEAQEAAVCQ